MLAFEETCRSYLIEIEEARFLDLCDSESYVTDSAAYKAGAETLREKLEKLPGVSDIDYNGHFGAAVFVTIDAEDDNDDLKQKISQIIQEHLLWCAAIPKAKHVLEERRESTPQPSGDRPGP